MNNTAQCKFIVVTGGVISGIGKGVTAASIGHLLKNQHKIIPIKCDGYLNTDPGTMSPKEHGEVYVLDDGGEVDMDFGHYERFLNVDIKSKCSVTMGKVYKKILQNEREGKYLGKTVQLIPHVTNEIKRRFYKIIEEENADIALIEIGGTVGDMENELFIESVRQLANEVGRENIMFIHLTFIPIPHGTNEQKSKPTQQSIQFLHKAGIYPDMIIGRCNKPISDNLKDKISMYCNIGKESVLTSIDVDYIYELPLVLEKQGFSQMVNKRLNIEVTPQVECLEKYVGVLKKNKKSPAYERNIAICGKYTELEDSYASVAEALTHCSAHLNCKINIKYIDTIKLTDDIASLLKGIDGVIIPGGFGSRGMEGKISIIRYARENDIPFLGLCLGMQLAVIEFARNMCNIKAAESLEIEKDGLKAEEPVVGILPEQLEVELIGGSMRLGGQNIKLKEGTIAYQCYKTPVIRERFRHRYEVNPKYVKQLEDKGLVFSGISEEKDIMQMMELPNHRFFVATQAHPELTSRIEKPSPLFYHFIKNCIKIEGSKDYE